LRKQRVGQLVDKHVAVRTAGIAGWWRGLSFEQLEEPLFEAIALVIDYFERVEELQQSACVKLTHVWVHVLFGVVSPWDDRSSLIPVQQHLGKPGRPRHLNIGKVESYLFPHWSIDYVVTLIHQTPLRTQHITRGGLKLDEL
jgi:hypothetical protein